VARGWGSADVSVRNAHFRFVNSHLEAFDIPGGDAELIRQGQVAELLEAQAQLAERKGKLPTVYVGDYNTAAPSAPAYTQLLAGVGRDAWTVLRGSKPGNTCCFDAAVKDPADPLTSRIDLVLVTKRITVKGVTRVGEDPQTDLTKSGLWPSDHAGVAARLLIGRWPTR
jgi:endonuclease/exonuclease/phosphatase family metal-dependent hydrolase